MSDVNYYQSCGRNRYCTNRMGPCNIGENRLNCGYRKVLLSYQAMASMCRMGSGDLNFRCPMTNTSQCSSQCIHYTGPQTAPAPVPEPPVAYPEHPEDIRGRRFNQRRPELNNDIIETRSHNEHTYPVVVPTRIAKPKNAFIDMAKSIDDKLCWRCLYNADISFTELTGESVFDADIQEWDIDDDSYVGTYVLNINKFTCFQGFNGYHSRCIFFKPHPCYLHDRESSVSVKTGPEPWNHIDV